MKKALSLILAALMLLLTLTACKASPSAAPTEEPPAGATDPEPETPVEPDDAAGVVTLNTVSMFGGTDPAAPYYDELIAGYEAATGNIVNDASESSSEEWKATVVLDFSTGNEPDVIFYFNGLEAEALMGKVVDIDTIRSVYPDYARDILPDALKAMEEEDGKVYAVPVKGYFEGLYVNKAIFDQYSLELPTDWDKLVTAIQTLRENNIDPFSISFVDEPHYMIEYAILTAGGIADHSAVPTDDLATVPDSWAAGLDLFKTLGDLGAFPADAATKKTATAQQDFYDGKAAMFVDGSWRTGGIIEAGIGDDVVMMSFPVMPGGKGDGTQIIAGFGSGFYITQKAWDDPVKQKAAVDFVNHMTTAAAVEALMAKGAGAAAAKLANTPEGSLVLSSGAEMVANASGTDKPVDSRLKKGAWSEIVTGVADIASGKMTGQQLLELAIPQNQ